MELPQHWVTADGFSPHLGRKGGTLTVWGWSSDSEADAVRVADQRLADALERIAREGGLPPGRGYYPRMPLREPVLEEVDAASGALLGVVTRNRMGCEVLCTDLLFIADVDVPELEDATTRRTDAQAGSGLASSLGSAIESTIGPRSGGLGGFLRRLLSGDPAPTPMAPAPAVPGGDPGGARTRRMPVTSSPRSAHHGRGRRASPRAWPASRCGSSPGGTPTWGCGSTARRPGCG